MMHSKIIACVPVILACLAVTLPLLGSQVLFFPAAWGQALAFRILVSLCLVFALFQIGQWPSFLARLRQAKHILIPLGSFAIVFLLALVFSEDRYMSFWGLPTRAWGIAHLIPLFLFALFVFLFLRKTDWKWVWGSVFASGLIMALVALSQQQGWFSDALVQYPRPPGTLGNSIFLGMYLLSLALIAFSFAFANRGVIRLLLIATSVVLAGGMLLSLSRGALFGFGAGLLFFFALFPGKSRIPRFFTLFLLLGGISLFLFINAAPNPFPEFPLASNMWDRFQSENLLDQARILGWQSVLRGVAEKPFLGYGPYNSFIPFNAHFNPILTEITGSTGYWDTAHNEFLDILAGSGALGLLAYLGFLGALLWQLEKAKLKNPDQKFLLHAMQTALVGQHVALLFFPNTFATSLMLLLSVGFSLSLLAPSSSQTSSPSTSPSTRLGIFKKKSFSGALALTSLVVLVLLNWQITLKPLFINRDINKASILAELNQCEPALALGEQTLRQGTFINYYSHLRYVDLISACMGRAKNSVLELSGKAVASLKEEVGVRPKEPRTWMLLGGYTNNLASAAKNESEKLA
ncbi:MAG: O-antigen ligase family protein, partial [Parcubacteria group bacterium]|nr:O-antigen ligase family protein [Parcubacteria group bacterium]